MLGPDLSGPTVSGSTAVGSGYTRHAIRIGVFAELGEKMDQLIK